MLHSETLPDFNTEVFLSTAGLGRTIVKLNPKDTLFVQGDATRFVFFLQKGRAKLTVVSPLGKEATISLLSPGEFIGEESMTPVVEHHTATAVAITACSVLKIERSEMIRAIHKEHSLSDLFLTCLLTRNIRTQADLVDQLFNSSEKRLARTLLLMAGFDSPGESIRLIPKVSQEALAEMVGTTRSRVSHFMNRFRELGFMSTTTKSGLIDHCSTLFFRINRLSKMPQVSQSQPDSSAEVRLRAGR